MSVPPLFPHQEKAFACLAATARVFFSRKWRRLSIAPRFSRLVIGETGTGKTHLIRRLAEEFELPLMELSATNWIPLGCTHRGACPTWPQLLQFCCQHRRGLIFLDEADKLFGKTDWSTSVRVEIFLLLDQRIPRNVDVVMPYRDEARTLRVAANRLRRSFLVVGAGAFQFLWETRLSSVMGFRTPDGDIEVGFGHRELGTVIPSEIVNRFASPILTLRPLLEGDYRRMLASALSQLPPHLRNPLQCYGEEGIREAVANRLGCRWIEELLLRVMIEEELRPRFEPT